MSRKLPTDSGGSFKVGDLLIRRTTGKPAVIIERQEERNVEWRTYYKIHGDPEFANKRISSVELRVKFQKADDRHKKLLEKQLSKPCFTFS